MLTFCLVIGVCFVSPENWWNVFSGFWKFGNVPVEGADGREAVDNVFLHYRDHGTWPVIALANIAVLGGFAGYAGGGGLGNSTYSNFVRDKGWGMGRLVGAIPSAIGGRKITLSHLGTVFPVTPENLRRWKAWWKYILTDQLLIWMPGCFMGMALPALISIEFSQYSPLFQSGSDEELKTGAGTDYRRRNPACPVAVSIRHECAVVDDTVHGTHDSASESDGDR